MLLVNSNLLGEINICVYIYIYIYKHGNGALGILEKSLGGDDGGGIFFIVEWSSGSLRKMPRLDAGGYGRGGGYKKDYPSPPTTPLPTTEKDGGRPRRVIYA